MRLIEHSVVVMVVVVLVDDIFSIVLKSRCDKFGVDLNRYVPITNLGNYVGTQVAVFPMTRCWAR